MADQRLNSLHLDPVRRQDFRRARDVLLGSRGNQTLIAENHGDLAEKALSGTIIQDRDPAALAALDYWLVDKEFVYPLRVGVNTMGRSSDNDVVVEDAFVSRRHCAILVHHNQRCELHDTASKNGTYLNGHKLGGPTFLKSGDEIRICDRQFVFLTNHDNRSSPSPTPTLAQ